MGSSPNRIRAKIRALLSESIRTKPPLMLRMGRFRLYRYGEANKSGETPITLLALLLLALALMTSALQKFVESLREISGFALILHTK
jgi:hypothetical protein